MALVTVQRSPSVAGSPQCSISDGDGEEDEIGKCERSCSSECFFAGKGTALVLALKDIPQYAGERRLSTDSTRSTNSTQSNNSDIQLHLQSMFNLLRHDETLKMAVKLESQRPNRTRYLAIATRSNIRNSIEKKAVAQRSSSKASSLPTKTKYSNSEKQDNLLTTEKVSNYKCSFQDNKIQNKEQTSISGSEIDEKSNRRKADRQDKVNTANDIEESCLLGIDCNEKTTIGLVVPILADTTIHLDGDGGFSVSVYGKTHIFKPVSVQAMWSALQTLHKVSQKARESNFYPGGPSHEWIAYYEKRIESDQSCLNEWNAMDALESRRPPSPDAIRNKPTEREETEQIIRMKLKEIMMSVDLDEVTSKYIRSRLEDLLDMDLGEYKSFIDEEMLTILGQMDAPTEIFEHVYLGSEWNASNLEELQRNGVRHILNVTREIDNFFPGMFDYFNVRVYDDEKTNLLKYWDNTYRYISSAKATGSKVLVHCKMGVSRSASVVIAYAMKAYNWDFEQALQHVKDRRSCIKPNKNFLSQLETYRGMLDAMKNKEKLQRSKSETNLKSTKDARLLPGSEPTPLIQAWNQSKKTFAEKQRKLLRRSSSTSPKSIQSSIVIKQQSQSLENLTPDRTTVDMMQKNVRFPASNGQNYSVTQNQILHIQKNSPTTLVKTIVSGLELIDRKTSEDRKSLNLQIDRSISVDGTSSRASETDDQTNIGSGNSKTLGSPVWTSSAKLIQQTSNILPMQDDTASAVVIHRVKEPTINQSPDGDIFSSQLDNVFDKLESRQGTRKTQSWTAASEHGDAFASRQSSTSSIDSAVVLAYQGERRELPSRHSSWGSGDNRILPSRNSSWGSYDTNRHKIYNTAIFEGQIQNCHHDFAPKETNAIPRIAPSDKNDATCNPGTVKRTKQKLEESTVLKKRCQNDFKLCAESKRSSNLCRSESAVSSRQRHPSRCNSEELILSKVGLNNTQELSVSAPDSYPISQMGEQTDNESTPQNKDEEKISGNVQSLKKSFEAKANKPEKKGKSLPSSPVAVHASDSTTNTTAAATSQIKLNRTDNIATETNDRNVKGLVNKYQSTGHRSTSNSISSSLKMRPSSFYESRTSNNINTLRTSERSNNNANISKVRHDFNSRPPPVPTTIAKPLHHPSNNSSITMTEGILSQNLSCNYRRMQQHGKTHPLARLSLNKPRLNTAAAYNTM